jgi:penicillin-binding protein 1A
VSPGEAESQRRRALDKMHDQGRISEAQYAEATAQRVVKVDNGVVKGEPATLVYPAQNPVLRFPWFSDYVRGYLLARYGDEKVYQGGLRVETSIDPGLQAKAEAAVANALKGTAPPIDMAMTSLDPRTGLVKAMVGGRDFAKSQVNLALGRCPAATPPADGAAPAPDDGPVCVAGGGTGRQPGSSFKPFTLAEAFEQGAGPDKTYTGPGSYTYPRCKGEGCTVHNVESGSYGTLTLRQATAYSVNTVYAQLIQDVGVKKTAELAHRLGITEVNADGKLPTGEPYGPSLTLGAAEVAPLDMAAAYGVFAARGMQFAATPVLRVLGPDGEVLEDNRTRPGKRVLSADVADQVTDVLKDVVGYGTGKVADIGRPNGTAGKTGTSENFSDAWFVGYTPQLSTSVWMGFADSQKPLANVAGLPRVYGGTIPAKAWHDFMSAALDGVPTVDFTPPPAPPAPLVQPPPAPSPTVPPMATTLPTVPGQIDPSNFPPPYNLPPYSQAPYNPYLPVTPTTPTTATTVPAGAFTSPTSQPGTQAPFLPPQYGTTNTTALYQAAPVR